MKTLIVFYSNSSHTRQVAQILAAALSADLEEIHTVEPYGDELMTRSKAEIERGIYPEIRPLTHQPKDYDTILLGTQVWWLSPSSPILRFLADNDLSGKAVYPFITTGFDVHGVEEKLDEKLPKGTAHPALIVPFNNAFMAMGEDEITAWAKKIH